MKFSKRLLPLLLLAICWLTPAVVTAQAAQQSDLAELMTQAEQAMFIRGQGLYNQGLYSEAINVLNQFLERYPHSLINDLGLLWLGRSYLAQNDLGAAEKVGQRLRSLPDSSMVAIYEEELRLGRQNYVRAALGPARVANSLSTPLSITAADPQVIEPAAIEQRVVASGPEVQKPAPVVTSAVTLHTEMKGVAKPANGPEKKIPGSGLFLSSAVEAPVESAKGPGPRDDERRLNVVAPARNTPASAPSGQALKATQTVNSLSSPTLAVAKNSSPSSPAPAFQSASGAPLLRASTNQLPLADGQTSYRLTIVNEGNGAAKDLTVRIELDGALVFVASDPVLYRQELIARKQILTFRLPLIESAQSRVLQITVRSLNANTVDLNTQIKHAVFYRDSNGKLLHTP